MSRITHLTALGNEEGNDKIVGQCDGLVNLSMLKERNLLYKLVDENGSDKLTAMVLSSSFIDYIDTSTDWGKETLKWYNDIKNFAWVIVIHNYEWETGMDA